MSRLTVPDYKLDPPEYLLPVCPMCGAECYTFYLDATNNIVGCENCITSQDSTEYIEDM